MWYKSGPMGRRGLCATLLVIVAVQLLGGMAFASVCSEPCADDEQETGCPPICALCTSCTHAQTAIVQRSTGGLPLMSARHFASQHERSPLSQLTDDIFHVPLLG